MATCMRGPAIMPRSTAIFSPAGEPAASRTVVTPASSVARIRGMAWSRRREGGVSRPRSTSGYSSMKWTWVSINPGKMLPPSASMTVVPRGIVTWSWRSKAMIRSFSMSNVIPVSGSPSRPSIMVPFVIASISYKAPTFSENEMIGEATLDYNVFCSHA